MRSASLAIAPTLVGPDEAGGADEERFLELLQELAATPAPSVYQLQPGTSLGPYRVIAPIGRGGMGEVYHGRDERLSRDVAIKLLSFSSGAAERILRFATEARVLASLRHPAIPAVFDLGVEEGVPYLVMELLQGETLRARLQRGPLSLSEALQLAVQLAAGLGAAHQRGVVHRDLKPENLMLCSDGLKILDFGLAKHLGPAAPELRENATKAGAILGTAHYMSPEQVRGDAVDQRSDVFSFGIILYEMLAGRTPFSGESPVEAMAAILKEDPQPIARPLPSALLRVLSRCLQRPREERLADGAALSARLLSLVSEPEHALQEPGGGARTRQRPPETRYTKSGSVHLAFQTFGHGDAAIVFVPGFVSQVEVWWEEPEGAAFFSRLGEMARVVLFDKRGTGLSDRVPDDKLPTLAERMDDIRAVMDAAQMDRAIIFGISEGGPMAVHFSEMYPERAEALILYGTAQSFRATMELDVLSQLIRECWGQGDSQRFVMPSLLGDARVRRWVSRWERLSASPGAALAIVQMLAQIDVGPLLPQVKLPTLVLHREGDRLVHVEGARRLAAAIPGARYIEYPGADHAPMTGGAQALLEDVEHFLGELRDPR